jgi:antibiotic biosynthesis monooxygenase (ABM) superfamily enzyme
MLLILVVCFPLIHLMTYILGPMLHSLPPLLRSLAMMSVSVGFRTYVIIPQVTRLCTKWLCPGR